MKIKILQALKTKYATLGFGDKAFDGVADFLSKTVTEESQIETAIVGVEGLLKGFQSDSDHLRGENTNLKKSLDDYKAAHPETTPETKPEGDVPSWFKDWSAKQEKEIADLKKTNETKTAAETKAAREARILAKAKALKISQTRIEEGFSIAEDLDETGIDAYLAKVAQNDVARQLPKEDTGLSLSASDKVIEEIAAAGVSNLPDVKP